MGAIKDKLIEQINQSENSDYENAEGIVLEWDDISELAKIKFWNPKLGGYEYRGNVSVSNCNGGVSNNALRPGQKVNIQFINRNMHCPIITGVKNNYYSNRSNTDQGAFIPDDEVYKTGTPEHLVAMNLDWIDEDNQSDEKYNNEITDYRDADANKQTIDMLTRLDKYEKDEVGLTNMQTNSSVRLRENGDVDIFSAYNTGIRITSKGIIKLYCKDLEYSDLSGELDDTDRSIVTRIRAYQTDNIIETQNNITVIEDILDTINKIKEMKHIVDNSSINTQLLSLGNFQKTQAKIDAYYNQKGEFMAIPIEKDDMIAKYGNAFIDYREYFFDFLKSLINTRIEIESGFETPCAGYIELFQPAEECSGQITIYDGLISQEDENKLSNDFSLNTDPRYEPINYHGEPHLLDKGTSLYAIKNYELDIKVTKEDITRTTSVTVQEKVIVPDISYEDINNIDSNYIPEEDHPLSGTNTRVVSGITLREEMTTQTYPVVYDDSQTSVDVEKVYYEHKQSLYVPKDKTILCSGDNVNFYFYPIIK